jgi:hypothetical protein
MKHSKIKARDAYVYYIYVDGIVRYVGKGSGNRAASHMSVVKKLADKTRKRKPKATMFQRRLYEAYVNGAVILPPKLVEVGLTHFEAYARETLRIAEIRSRSPDQLWNVTDGGNGGWPAYAAIQRLWKDPYYRVQMLKTLPHLSEEYREQISKTMKKIRGTPEIRALVSAEALERWSDPEYKERVTAAIKATMATPAYRKQRRAIMRQLQRSRKWRKAYEAGVAKSWADPKRHERQSAIMTKVANRPEVKETSRRNARKNWRKPAYQRKVSKGLRRAWQKPGHKEKVAASISAAAVRRNRDPKRREEVSANCRAAALKRSADPKNRALLSRLAKERWANPAWRRRVKLGIRRAMARPEVRERVIKGCRVRSADPAYLAKLRKKETTG